MTQMWLVGARLVDGTGADPVDGRDLQVVDGASQPWAPLPRAPTRST